MALFVARLGDRKVRDGTVSADDVVLRQGGSTRVGELQRRSKTPRRSTSTHIAQVGRFGDAGMSTGAVVAL